MKHVICDMDFGVDDATALFVLLNDMIYNKSIRICALTTCFGNVPRDQGLKNADVILNMMQLAVNERLQQPSSTQHPDLHTIPIYPGAKTPLIQDCIPPPPPSWEGHGQDGFGNYTQTQEFKNAFSDLSCHSRVVQEHAASALVRMVNEQPHHYTLLATGPLTNVALALQLDPSFLSKLNMLYVMGGSIHSKGNSNRSAEFNFHSDPEAAYIVLHAAKQVTMATRHIILRLVTWETTVDHAFSWSFFDSITQSSSILSRFLKNYVQEARRIMQRHQGNPDVFPSDLGFLMCDFYAAAWLLNEKCALKWHDLDSTVELNGIHSRGAVFYDWYGETGIRNARLVLDVGCGEGALIQILQNGHFSRIAGVDVDEQSLVMAKYACRPTTFDKTFLRDSPCTVELYQGSVAQPDSRLIGYEAITALEVIEHLHPDTLEAFPHITLGYYRPRIMIVSTPNAEFNVFFPNLKYGTAESIFRHDDHKFEWTRAQFQQWAHCVASQYNYTVLFTGVGLYKQDPGGAQYGHCSQFGIFIRNDFHAHPIAPAAPMSSYTLVETIQLPVYDEPLPSDSEILFEVKQQFYSIRIECDSQIRFSVPTDDEQVDEIHSNHMVHIRVDLEKVWGKLRIRQLCKSKDNLLRILQTASHEFMVLHETDPRVYSDAIPVILEQEPDRLVSEQVWLPIVESIYPKQPRILIEGFFVLPMTTEAEEEDMDASTWQGTWLEEEEDS